MLPKTGPLSFSEVRGAAVRSDPDHVLCAVPDHDGYLVVQPEAGKEFAMQCGRPEAPRTQKVRNLARNRIDDPRVVFDEGVLIDMTYESQIVGRAGRESSVDRAGMNAVGSPNQVKVVVGHHIGRCYTVDSCDAALRQCREAGILGQPFHRRQEIAKVAGRDRMHGKEYAIRRIAVGLDSTAFWPLTTSCLDALGRFR